jgi:hypothetical protein
MWFLDREVEDGSWNHSVFAKNSERVLSLEVAVLFFRAVYDQRREAGWASDDHISADGTLIEAWASMKSFVRKDGGDATKVDKGKDDDPGNPTIDFKWETRRNDTHQSTTVPEAVLFRKGRENEARLAYGFHALMENRNGLLAEFDVHNPIEVSEAAMTLGQLQARAQDSGYTPRTAAGDKGYHTKAFVQRCRNMGVRPHVAQIEKRRVNGLDGRTTRTPRYKSSQRIRKQIEKRFGWMKVVGGLRRTTRLGSDKVATWGSFIAAACNLVLMSRLAHAPPGGA